VKPLLGQVFLPAFNELFKLNLVEVGFERTFLGVERRVLVRVKVHIYVR
jgi:hypothetical protein